jgi:uncharacterized protein
VDSSVLAHAAFRFAPDRVRLIHAMSPAVPAAAGARVERMRLAGLPVELVDAGEFADARYLANPANRCFFCKSNLYQTLARLAVAQGADVASGANVDDLDDWRPGLKAAADHGVVHPYVELGARKDDVRALARLFGMEEIAELPASPCLSSRVETGLAVEPEILSRIDRTETKLRELLPGVRDARCRSRRAGIVIELDEDVIATLSSETRTSLVSAARTIWRGDPRPISLAPYRRGGAFLRP